MPMSRNSTLLRQGGMWISSSSPSLSPPRHPQLLIFPRLSSFFSFSLISSSLIPVPKKTCHSGGWNSQPLDPESKTLTTRPLGLLLYIALEVLWVSQSFAEPGEVTKWFLNCLGRLSGMLLTDAKTYRVGDLYRDAR